ncbi:MAG: DUF2029 domain-containing protein [Clostridia bacterium]|nr:DUF2029 domain-containing protein [Clostridia bacterium]
MDIRVMLIFGSIAILSLVFLWEEGLIYDERRLLITIFCIAAAFIVRALLLEYRSGDYNSFLVKWVDYYRQNGGFSALKDSLGNYNLPYLYFLCLFSYSTISDLYLIKLLSVFFDVILAFGMMKLAGVYTRSKGKRLAAFLITLLLPTVILNGAKWGQCDSIYVSFAVLALWLVLSGRPKWSMVCMALSFGFKLQAVFIMPVFLVMLFAKKIRFFDYLVFPLTYLVLMLPAVIAGRPFADAFLLYLNQAQTVGTGLNYNSPSFWSFISSSNVSALSAAGVAVTFLLVFMVIFLCWKKRKNLTDEALLFVTLLFVVGIPFLLPHMHDRYFFMADVLVLMPAIIWPQYTPIAVLTSFASILCYYSYLTLTYLLPIQYGAIALIGVLIVLIIVTADKLNSRRFDILS